MTQREENDFIDLYFKATNPQMITSSVIAGHLMIEFLLRKLIQAYDPALSKLSDTLGHYRLINLNYDLGLITDKQRGVLVTINKIRNKFAHDITYHPSIRELVELFRLAINAFDDFTDGISQGLFELRSVKRVEDLEDWVLCELFVQISYDLYHEYQSISGDSEF
jgi:hypothetical protein